MKSGCVLVLGLALSTGIDVAGAQSGAPTGGQSISQCGPGRDPMMRGIVLTPDQQAKVSEITAKYSAERPDRTLRQSDCAAFLKTQAAFNAKVNPEVRTILTVEQQAVWDRNALAEKARADSIAKINPAP